MVVGYPLTSHPMMLFLPPDGELLDEQVVKTPYVELFNYSKESD
jgi:hypothetical protein